LSDTTKQIDSLLRQHGFRLIRDTKHCVYRNPDGKIFICSKTPSDYRAGYNKLTNLKSVIANPPRPEIVAISEFEREQAAQIIQGQDKLPGPGRNKQKRTSGTGIYWKEPEVMNVEQQLIQEQQRERARKNKDERRARKLALREERAAIKAARHAEQARLWEQQRPQREAEERRREHERQERKKWGTYVQFNVFEDNEINDKWFAKVLRDGKKQDFTINVGPYCFKEEGVLTHMMVDKSDLKEEEESHTGRYPVIISRYLGGFTYKQFHPLGVASCEHEIVYAPWLNPGLPECYRNECRKMFPDKAPVFDQEMAAV